MNVKINEMPSANSKKLIYDIRGTRGSADFSPSLNVLWKVLLLLYSSDYAFGLSSHKFALVIKF